MLSENIDFVRELQFSDGSLAERIPGEKPYRALVSYALFIGRPAEIRHHRPGLRPKPSARAAPPVTSRMT